MALGLAASLLALVGHFFTDERMYTYTYANCTVLFVLGVCPTLEDPVNGTVKQTGIDVGSVANYSCNEGLMIVNGDSVRICQENGTWSGRAPQCVPSPPRQPPMCEILEDPNNGNVTFNDTGIGSVAIYSCGLGFTLQGSANRTCQQQNPDANVTWSGSAPTCESELLKI